jgi:hypothetical protein
MKPVKTHFLQNSEPVIKMRGMIHPQISIVSIDVYDATFIVQNTFNRLQFESQRAYFAEKSGQKLGGVMMQPQTYKSFVNRNLCWNFS